MSYLSGDELYGDEITSPIYDDKEPTPMSDYEDDNLSFGEWLRKLNEIVISNCGVSLDDLEDFCTRDAYDDGMSPQEFFYDQIEPTLQ